MPPAPEYEHRLDIMEQQGARNENRLLHVERSVDIVSKQVDGLSNRLDTQVGGLNAKLDTVVTAVTTVTSRPQWDLQKFLDIGLKGGGLAVLVASLITYIATNINAVENVRNQMRMEFLQQRVENGWFGKSGIQIRAPNGTVTPQ